MIFGVLCHDRPAYLFLTLKSLRGVLEPEDKVIVFDDGSRSLDMDNYLRGYETFQLSKPLLWPENEDREDRLGWMPEVTALTPLETQFPTVEVQYGVNLGVTGHALRSQRALFNRFPDEKFVVLVEADTVFRRDFRHRLVNEAAALDMDAGILGLCNIAYYPAFHPPELFSAQCWLVTRELHLRFASRNVYAQRWQRETRNGDRKRIEACRMLGLTAELAQAGLCQHIGIEDSVWKKNQDGELNRWCFDKTTVKDAWF